MGGDKSEDDEAMEAIEAVAKAKAKRGKAKAAAGPKKTARASRKEAPREGQRTEEKAKRKPKKGGGATEAGKTKLRRMSEHISDGNAGKGSAHSVEDATPKETKEGKVVASAGGAKPEGKVVDSALWTARAAPSRRARRWGRAGNPKRRGQRQKLRRRPQWWATRRISSRSPQAVSHTTMSIQTRIDMQQARASPMSRSKWKRKKQRPSSAFMAWSGVSRMPPSSGKSVAQ